MQSPGTTSINHPQRKPQVCILGSAEPGSPAYALAGEAGALLARLGITVVSGCGSPATRVAAECAVAAGGLVISIIPQGDMPAADWPAGVVIPCGMGDARNLLMALAGDACIVIAQPTELAPMVAAYRDIRPAGRFDGLPANPPDERQNAPILPWACSAELQAQLRALGLVPDGAAGT